MAQFLYERHSINVHLSTVKRHMRLARQIKGAEDLASTIEPMYTDLLTKSQVRLSASENTEICRDTLALKDTLLDDKVRDLNEACKKHDRDNPGLPVIKLIFPEVLSSIVYAPLEEEPAVVEKIIIRIQQLGNEHVLASHIPLLQAAITDTKAAIEALHLAIQAEATASAFEAIAKLNLTRQYEQNIYAASSKFGKAFANRLFPAINLPVKSKNDSEAASEEK